VTVGARGGSELGCASCGAENPASARFCGGCGAALTPRDDGGEMAKEILLNLVVDRCPTCHGVWLDGGELEQMRGAIEEGLSKVLLRGMSYAG
jgi:hypothetical protein